MKTMLYAKPDKFQMAQMIKRSLLCGVLAVFLVACSDGSNSDQMNTQPSGNNNRVVDEKSQVILIGDNSPDPDDRIAAYLWEQVSGTSVQLQDTTSQSAQFTAPAVTNTAGSEVLQFKLTVTDDQGVSTEDQITITVNAFNEPPVAQAGADIVVEEGQTIVLSGSQSSDPDQDALSYTWQQQTGGQTSSVAGGNAETLSLVAPDVDEDTTLVFVLTVTDGFGGVASDEVSVLVKTKEDGETPGILTITIKGNALESVL